MIELWQADSQGRYRHPFDPQFAAADKNFSGFGRLETDANGVCVFETVKPGRIPSAAGSAQAPHINVTLFARGLGKPLRTRVYFAGEHANAGDPVLSLVPAERRETLLAKPVAGQVASAGPLRSICKAKRKRCSSISKIRTCNIR